MKIFKNIKVKNKLLTLFVTFFVPLIALGVFSIVTINKISESSEIIFKENLGPIKLIHDMETKSLMINMEIFKLMLASDDSLNEQYIDNLNLLKIDQEQLTKQFPSTEYNHTKEVNLLFADYMKARGELIETNNKIIELAVKNKNKEAYAIFLQEVESIRKKVNGLLHEITSLLEAESEQAYHDSINMQKKVTILLIITISVSAITSFVIGLFIVKAINVPIREIVKLLGEVEKGDFTVKGTYEAKDELGFLSKSFNNMIQNVNNIMMKVKVTSEQVAAAAEQLSASAEENTKASEFITATIVDVSEASGVQASNMNHVSVIIDDNAVMSKQVLANTEVITENVQNAAEVSADGRKVINKVSGQMTQINHTVHSVAESFKEFTERSKEIGNINDVITSIAGQTNLLALNAAIEAARAGESGKGFGVVAEEVKKLADESAASAQQISRLVSQIQKDTDSTMYMVNQATKEVQEGLVVVQEVGVNFTNIETIISDVTPQIEEEKQLVHKLLASNEQVHTSVDEVKSLADTTATGTQNVTAATEEQLASMQEIASSSTSLAQLAEELNNLIKQFKI
ncbi:methyl-accepting chemotaxis protein [Bacillus sp. Au-Bac7]|uniref:methyl-accepting chemotaxis protein n=1 Tax=Bacillus sp. Au-Bac7 TaxID=2906458 RepID=UPI001E5761FD|nr:HAMP domain-containing methyl-accepting chemotaxis protein [Bacillus sp. Au-Bac7]MCE4047408.1 methyl-accepting chemotaxis protein [Bacillus sp. Au-Bac7]